MAYCEKCAALQAELAEAKKERDEATQQRDILHQQLATEQERWQSRFDFLHKEYGVDGGGCESGDELDFTESEVRQALAKVEDQRDKARKEIERWRAKIPE